MTLESFYDLMKSTAECRRRIVAAMSRGDGAPNADRGVLEEARETLTSLPGAPDEARLRIGAGEIALNLEYELGELKKDLLFLEGGPDALSNRLAKIHAGFREQVNDCVEYMRQSPPDLFITDRDGTINNYCGRYRSSVQSAYNALFISRFAAEPSRRNIILTSAPLAGGGLLDVNTMAENLFVLAGSKGREYRDEDGREGRLDMTAEQADLMNRLNEELEELLAEPEHREFALIGSGLQRKFGQATVARQDSNGSIAPARSEDFLGIVTDLVARVDAKGDGLHMEDTGLDIEIMLTADASEARAFDKGDGLLFLDKRLGLRKDMTGCALVCGDTAADLSMVEAAARLRPRVMAIFVTGDPELRAAVRSLVPDAVFPDSPDILVSALGRAAARFR